MNVLLAYVFFRLQTGISRIAKNGNTNEYTVVLLPENYITKCDDANNIFHSDVNQDLREADLHAFTGK